MPRGPVKKPIQISVSISPAIAEALQIATEYAGTSESQYCCQALMLTLVSQGFMKHPMQHRQQQQAAPATATAGT